GREPRVRGGRRPLGQRPERRRVEHEARWITEQPPREVEIAQRAPLAVAQRAARELLDERGVSRYRARELGRADEERSLDERLDCRSEERRVGNEGRRRYG